VDREDHLLGPVVQGSAPATTADLGDDFAEALPRVGLVEERLDGDECLVEQMAQEVRAARGLDADELASGAEEVADLDALVAVKCGPNTLAVQAQVRRPAQLVLDPQVVGLLVLALPPRRQGRRGGRVDELVDLFTNAVEVVAPLSCHSPSIRKYWRASMARRASSQRMAALPPSVPVPSRPSDSSMRPARSAAVGAVPLRTRQRFRMSSVSRVHLPRTHPEPILML
jgi:hypothetical protein